MRYRPQGYLNIHEAAESLGVHYKTLEYWTNEGKLPVLKIGKKNVRYYSAKMLRRFKKNNLR